MGKPKIILALVLILLLGFLLRFYHYDKFPRHGATFDEFAWTWQGISLWQTGVPTSWSPHPQYQNAETKKFQGAWVRLVTPYLEHPPLFGLVAGGFALATGSKDLFDVSLSQIRILSLVLGTLSVFLVFLLARKLYDPFIGLLAALLYATIPTVVIGSRLVQNENFLIPVMLIVWLLLLYQKYLAAAILAGLLTLAKVPWSFVTLAGCLLLTGQKKFREALVFGLIATTIFSFYFLYGWHYDWATFSNLWGLQMGRARIGLGTTLALFTDPFLADRSFPDGWIYFGWIAVFILSLDFKKHSRLLMPLLAYFLVFVFAIPGAEAQGWYRYPFYPFLAISSAVVIKKISEAPSLFNLFFFFLIAASAFHWGWAEKFGMDSYLFRSILVFGSFSFLHRKATWLWLVIFIVLNILSVLFHFHS